MTPRADLETGILALLIWREARGEPDEAKLAVGCSVRNRVQNPAWWGYDYLTVALKPMQYSSFNRNDPNSREWPNAADPSWQASYRIAQQVLSGCSDNSAGADSYFDASLDANPPAWTKAPASKTCEIGRLRFWRTRPV